MRFVYTRRSLLGLPRAYLKIASPGAFIDALVDTGSDRSVLPEPFARSVGIAYAESDPTFAVGGPIRTYEATEPVRLTLFAPHKAGSGIEWLVLGSHELRPLIVPAAFHMPALVGRLDLLVHYRLILEEARGRFDLRPLRTAPQLKRVSRG